MGRTWDASRRSSRKRRRRSWSCPSPTVIIKKYVYYYLKLSSKGYRKRNITYSAVLFLMRRCRQTLVKFVAVGRTYDGRNNNAISADTLLSSETQNRTSTSHSANKRDSSTFLKLKYKSTRVVCVSNTCYWKSLPSSYHWNRHESKSSHWLMQVQIKTRSLQECT